MLRRSDPVEASVEAVAAASCSQTKELHASSKFKLAAKVAGLESQVRRAEAYASTNARTLSNLSKKLDLLMSAESAQRQKDALPSPRRVAVSTHTKYKLAAKVAGLESQVRRAEASASANAQMLLNLSKKLDLLTSAEPAQHLNVLATSPHSDGKKQTTDNPRHISSLLLPSLHVTTNTTHKSHHPRRIGWPPTLEKVQRKANDPLATGATATKFSATGDSG